jgi:hypothetical protein
LENIGENTKMVTHNRRIDEQITPIEAKIGALKSLIDKKAAIRGNPPNYNTPEIKQLQAEIESKQAKKITDIVYPHPKIKDRYNNDFRQYEEECKTVLPSVRRIEREIKRLESHLELIERVILEDSHHSSYIKYAEEHGLEIDEDMRESLTPKLVRECNNHYIEYIILHEYERRDCTFDCANPDPCYNCEIDDLSGDCWCDNSTHVIHQGLCAWNDRIYVGISDPKFVDTEIGLIDNLDLALSYLILERSS